MDSTELIEHREDLAFAREQAATDKNVRSISLALGSLPTIGLMARLAQATQGYKTGKGIQPPSSVSPPPLIPPFIQNLIDAGITDIEALVNWIISNSPGSLPNTVKTITQDVYQALPPFIQQLLNAGVTDANGVLHFLGLPSIPGTGGTTAPARTDLINPATNADPGYTFVSAGFKTAGEAATYATGVPGGLVKQGSDGLYYVEQPTITGGRH